MIAVLHLDIMLFTKGIKGITPGDMVRVCRKVDDVVYLSFLKAVEHARPRLFEFRESCTMLAGTRAAAGADIATHLGLGKDVLDLFVGKDVCLGILERELHDAHLI